MTHLLAILVLSAVAPQERVADPDAAYDIIPPFGWEKSGVRPEEEATLARWRKPGAAGAGTIPTELSVRRVMEDLPMPLEEIKSSLRRHFESQFPDGFKEVGAGEARIDGLPAFWIAADVTALPKDEKGKAKGDPKRLLIVRGVIRRTSLERFLVDLLAPGGSATTNSRIYEEFIRSFRSLPSAPSAEEQEPLERFNALAETWARDKKAMGVDDWFNVTLLTLEKGVRRKLGHYHIRAQEAVVKSRPGISFETHMELQNLDGEKEVLATQGQFRFNLSHQEAVGTEVYTDEKGGVIRRHELSAVTTPEGFVLKNRYQIGERSYRDEATVAAPPGTVLTSVVELLRRPLASRGRGEYLANVLYMKEDRVRTEAMRQLGEGSIKQGEQSAPVRILTSRRQQGNAVTYHFTPEGLLLRQTVGQQVLQLDRTTPEDARTPPPKPEAPK